HGSTGSQPPARTNAASVASGVIAQTDEDHCPPVRTSRRTEPRPVHRYRLTTGSPSVDGARLISSTGTPARMPSTKHRRAGVSKRLVAPRSSSPQNATGGRSRTPGGASGPRSGAAGAGGRNDGAVRGRTGVGGHASNPPFGSRATRTASGSP